MDVDRQITQAEFAALVGVSEARVSQMLTRGQLEPGATGRRWITQYVARLREQLDTPAGATARERLMLAKARHQELRTKQLAGSVVSTVLLEAIVAQVGRRISAILETVPAVLQREFPDLPTEVVQQVHAKICDARNAAAELELDWSELERLA